MNREAAKYINVETGMSALSNAILNVLAGYAIFHGRDMIPVSGHGGLFQDSIGEIFLVAFGSFLVPTLIARHRRKQGTLPVGDGPPTPAGNIYLSSFVVGLVFSCVLVPCCALLLPRFFSHGVSFHHELLFKTVYGAFFGAIATRMALRRVLNEVS